jgi:radical SAM protein with 4Fe4S-binding SPASM domain
MYKKVYIEITNNCNLSCDFCIKNDRKVRYLSLEEFKIILDKIKPYTRYLYFHIMGEPLMHHMINYFIDYATTEGFKVNITTNGYLIDRIKDNKNIRQINISLHSYSNKYNISLDKYLNKICNVIDNMSNNGTYVSLRLWVTDMNTKDILDYLNKRYNTNINAIEDNIKIKDRIYLSSFHRFIWPDMGNDYWDSTGTCYGTRNHIGILVDGTVVPCCLDSKGIINLGNIYSDKLEDIINSKRYKAIKEGFCNNKKIEELCRHCKFLD